VLSGNIRCNDEIADHIYLNSDGEIRIKGTDSIILPSKSISVSYVDHTGKSIKNAYIAYTDKAIINNADGVEFIIGNDGAYISYDDGNVMYRLPQHYFSSQTPYNEVCYLPRRLSSSVSAIIVYNAVDSCILTVHGKGETINMFFGKTGDFRDVDFATNEVGYAISSPGTIQGYNFSTLYKTTDGGKTFNVIEEWKAVPGNVEIVIPSEDQIIYYGASRSGWGIVIENLEDLPGTARLPNFEFDQMKSWEYYVATTNVYFDNSIGIIEILVNRFGPGVCLMYYLTFDGGVTWYPYECYQDLLGIEDICFETTYPLN
jgi:hypothetical protein